MSNVSQNLNLRKNLLVSGIKQNQENKLPSKQLLLQQLCAHEVPLEVLGKALNLFFA